MSKKLSGDAPGGDSAPSSRSRRKLIGAAGMIAGAGAAAAATTAASIGGAAFQDRSIGGAPPPRRDAAFAPAATLAAEPGRINVKDYGAIGNGSADDTAAIVAARDAVLASANGNGWLTHHLYFPAGIYRVTKADALLPKGDIKKKINGYVIEGQGKRSSEIVFDAVAGGGDGFADNLLTAHGRLRQLRVREITFRASRPGLNWIYCWASLAQGTNQDFAFDDVEWRGPWNRVIGLDGPGDSNLNSEWSFNRCHLANDVVLGDAFLHSGMTPTVSQQDQFLNFWFRDCKFEYRSGTLLRFARGGYVNVYGGSWIQCNEDVDTPSVFFDLPPGPHNNTVKTLIVIGVRFELRHAKSKLMDCGWDAANGNISFIACTDAARSFQSHIGPVSVPVTYRPFNGDMPYVKWQSCQLMGRHESYATINRSRLVFEQCHTLNYTMDKFLVQK
ncbi:glycosyl hydrolase family 28-related protein [Lysobacter sp. TAB13]|uniref:glycosyl hydrolase family 28-related protein n=1 Tax=Lysobacter sp. TAB13 TaxID=3233065 RepID=UPI003F988681